MSGEIIDARKRFAKRSEITEELEPRDRLQAEWENFFLDREITSRSHAYVSRCLMSRDGLGNETGLDFNGKTEFVREARDSALASLLERGVIDVDVVERYSSMPVFDKVPPV